VTKNAVLQGFWPLWPATRPEHAPNMVRDAPTSPKPSPTWHKLASTSLNIGHLGIEAGFNRKARILQNVLWR